MDCCFVSCIQQFDEYWAVHQQRADNDEVIEFWACQLHNPVGDSVSFIFFYASLLKLHIPIILLPYTVIFFVQL